MKIASTYERFFCSAGKKKGNGSYFWGVAVGPRKQFSKTHLYCSSVANRLERPMKGNGQYGHCFHKAKMA